MEPPAPTEGLQYLDSIESYANLRECANYPEKPALLITCGGVDHLACANKISFFLWQTKHEE